MEMKKIVYRHWKTDELLSCIGEIVHNHPESDRLVVKDFSDDSFEDIIKETIVSIEDVDY